MLMLPLAILGAADSIAHFSVQIIDVPSGLDWATIIDTRSLKDC